MESSETLDRTSPATTSPAPEEPGSKGWFEANKALLITTVITAVVGPCAVIGVKTIADVWLKNQELSRAAKYGAELEVLKIRLGAEATREQVLQQQAHDDGLRREDLQRLEQQQTATQRQRILTFYAAVLAKLEQAEGVWGLRPIHQDAATMVQFDRGKLLPIYADAQKLISDNMDLVALNPSMRERMADFGRRVATYVPSQGFLYSPHGALQYDLRWAVNTLSQVP